jgi:alkanesulfonate monooxygenase SsuD/methylene tetrahydromethanopterin reductase-like flavin-dependent oxidoreductase (luciferase family)
MNVGVYLPQVGFAWDDLAARVVACDRAGIESVWLMDHLYPPGMPNVPAFESWTTATALAAMTERIRIGHLVLANALRHPALVAKMAVTLDHVSHGRLNLGLGSGSVAQELREFGLPFGSDGERAAALDEALTIIKRLFTDERVDFEGRHYRLIGAPSLPRPVQRPHPPIHVGGAGPKRTLPIVARHADVWNCPTYALGVLPERLATVRAECARIGRDPATLQVTEEAVLVLVARRDQVDGARAAALRRFGGPGWGFETHGYCGTPDDVLRRLEARARLGVDGVVFFLHDRGERETIELLAREVVPVAASGRPAAE